jgi:hypothetical protein
MRSTGVALAITFVACSSPPPGAPGDQPDAGGGGSDSDAAVPTDSSPPPAPAFRVTTSDVPLNPGDEVTFCYYFQTSNTTELSIKRWASHMTPGSHDMVVFLTSTMMQRPGTQSATDCGFGASGPVWTYSAITPDAEIALPPDDGNGVPVGQPIKAGQYGFIQVHYLNTTTSPIQAHVQLDAFAHDEGVHTTPAGPFVTYNDQISIPPATSPNNPGIGMVRGTCDFHSMAGPVSFYAMTTHTHKQGVHAFVTDGPAMVVDNTSWDRPSTRTWTAAPFFSFSANALNYQCDYVNPNNRTITTGSNAATDEVCMVVGYYFPAPGGAGHLCWDNAMIY